MEAEVYSLQTRNRGHERLPCPGAPQGPAHTMTIPLNILIYIQYWSLIYSFFIVC